MIRAILILFDSIVTFFVAILATWKLISTAMDGDWNSVAIWIILLIACEARIYIHGKQVEELNKKEEV